MTETIECQASRRGRTWTVHVPEHGVYGAGRTLKAARENTEHGLAVIGVTAEVRLVPVTPELEALRAIEAARAKALSKAVVALALRRTTLGDMARATGATTRQVKLILAEQALNARPADEQAPVVDAPDGPDR
ncbi:hypothetical protein [Kitasatospora sp. NPDC094016]|uniref:hypothetical protein n=1 Tax=Kitasatospora sp. NPDC094016 TaxID=3154986 RepID=UPI00331F5303